MSLTDDFLKAKEKNKTKQVTTNIFTFDTEGDELVGVLKQVGPFEEGIFDTDVNKYTFQTDNGLISTVLGAATDKQLGPKECIGKLMRIVYHGKKQLKNDKAVNLYTIETVG